MKSAQPNRNRRLFFAGAAVVLLLLAFAGYRTLRRSAGLFFGDFFYPYLAVMRAGADQISDQTLLLFNRYELAARVEQLMRTNRQLAAQAASAAELLAENEELRRLLQLNPPKDWRYQPAEVILRDPYFWNEHLTISIGADHGATPGNAVLSVTPEGRLIFIGVIQETTRHTSEVITTYSPRLRLSLLLTSTNAVGILNTGKRHPKSGNIPIGNLPAHQSYTPMEAVVTTGFEQGIPPGIKIGELDSVENINSPFATELQLSGLLKPAAQLNSLRFVLVALHANPVAGVSAP